MMVDGVDEADPYVRVVVGHQHDVEQLLALRVQHAQSGVDGLQSLTGDTATSGTTVRPTSARWKGWGGTKQRCVVEVAVSTLTKANAGPGAKGSFSCSIW